MTGGTELTIEPASEMTGMRMVSRTETPEKFSCRVCTAHAFDVEQSSLFMMELQSFVFSLGKGCNNFRE